MSSSRATGRCSIRCGCGRRCTGWWIKPASRQSKKAGNKHFANAFKIDPATGALTPHGAPLTLHTRPIHASVDMAGEYLLTAYNDPSGLTVHRINKDGTPGERVEQPNPLDTGKYAHQIRAAPDNRQVFMVTRGNNAPDDNPVNPGSLKTFSFKNGVLANLAAIQPGDGMQFGPRHLDFHPTQPWVYVSVESQNKLHVYKLNAETGISRRPLFVKETLSDPLSKLQQAAGPIHVHPDGRFVYLTPSGSPTSKAGKCSPAARTRSRSSPSTRPPASRP
jgi:6-phosphogluconolactonase (cycloisomerase 2 family)